MQRCLLRYTDITIKCIVATMHMNVSEYFWMRATCVIANNSKNSDIGAGSFWCCLLFCVRLLLCCTSFFSSPCIQSCLRTQMTCMLWAAPPVCGGFPNTVHDHFKEAYNAGLAKLQECINRSATKKASPGTSRFFPCHVVFWIFIETLKTDSIWINRDPKLRMVGKKQRREGGEGVGSRALQRISICLVGL